MQPTLATSATVPSGNSQAKAGRLRRLIPYVLLLLSLLLLASTLLVLVTLPPDFYAERLVAADELEQDRLSKEFLKESLRLLNDIQNRDSWSADFREPQINAWLARDFRQNHAEKALPKGVTDPRVHLDGEHLHVGFQVCLGPVTTVVQIGFRVWVPRGNYLAVELHQARAGMLPLPTTYVRRVIETAANNNDINVEWRRYQGKLVALLEFPRGQKEMMLKKVQVHEDHVLIKGNTGQFAYPATDYAPAAN